MIAMTTNAKPRPRLLAAIKSSAPSLTLLTGISGPMQDGPDPEVVRVPLQGHSTKTIKKRALVAPGTLLAEHPDPAVGDVHSPIMGIVADVTDSAVVITAGAGESNLPRERMHRPQPPRVSPRTFWPWRERT